MFIHVHVPSLTLHLHNYKKLWRLHDVLVPVDASKIDKISGCDSGENVVENNLCFVHVVTVVEAIIVESNRAFVLTHIFFLNRAI